MYPMSPETRRALDAAAEHDRVLDQLWQSAYADAAERLYGKRDGDELNDDQDAACIVAADAQLAAEAHARGLVQR